MTTGAIDFEQAIILTGYGKFHYSLAACCALCLLSTGFQNGLNAYILPVVQCDLNLSSAQMGYLNVSFLLGGICSAFLWGLLGDLLGRKKVLVFTLLSDWVITLCAGLSQSYVTLITFRFLNGFLIGAPGTLVYTYFAEFQPENKRTKAVCFIGMFFTVAWLLLPAFAWLIIPLSLEIKFSGFVFNSWRLFVIVLSNFSFIGGLWIFYLPESPKFLLFRGKSKQALTILKKIYSSNTGQTPENFPVRTLVNNVNLKRVSNNSNHTVGNVGQNRTVRLLKDAKNQIKLLFKSPLVFNTFLTSTLLFTNMVGYLGLGLWLPEILNRFEEYNDVYPDEKITVCELQELFKMTTENYPDNLATVTRNNLTEYKLDENNQNTCNSDLDTTVFLNTVVIGLSCIIGNVISTYLSGLVNRKVLPIVTMLIGAVSAAGIYWLNTSTQHLIMGSLFQASMATANIVLNGVVVELFPTAVSAMAMCTATLAGRLGAVVSNLILGFLLDKYCEIPLIIIVVTLSVGTILAFLIPLNEKPKDNEEHANEIYKSISDISVISNMR